jgi:hypothetical protein
MYVYTDIHAAEPPLFGKGKSADNYETGKLYRDPSPRARTNSLQDQDQRLQEEQPHSLLLRRKAKINHRY